MGWELFTFINIICYTFATLLQRILLKNKENSAIAYAIFFQILTGFLILIFVAFLGFKMPNFSQVIPNFLLMILLYSAGNIYLFKALSLVEASEFKILFITATLWTVGSAILFLGESVSLFQIIGAILILAGVVLVIDKRKNINKHKGSIYTLVAALFFGLAFTNDAFVVRHIDVASYKVFTYLIPGLVTLLIYPRSVKEMKPFFQGRLLMKLILFAALFAIASITVMIAYQSGRNAAQISIISQTSTILVVVLSIIFLRERSNLVRKIIGATLGVLGVVLMTL